MHPHASKGPHGRRAMNEQTRMERKTVRSANGVVLSAQCSTAAPASRREGAPVVPPCGKLPRASGALEEDGALAVRVAVLVVAGARAVVVVGALVQAGGAGPALDVGQQVLALQKVVGIHHGTAGEHELAAGRVGLVLGKKTLAHGAPAAVDLRRAPRGAAGWWAGGLRGRARLTSSGRGQALAARGAHLDFQPASVGCRAISQADALNGRGCVAGAGMQGRAVGAIVAEGGNGEHFRLDSALLGRPPVQEMAMALSPVQGASSM